MDPQARLRELLVMQLGSQVLQMCELQAQLDAAKAKIADYDARDAERMKAIAEVIG